MQTLKRKTASNARLSFLNNTGFIGKTIAAASTQAATTKAETIDEADAQGCTFCAKLVVVQVRKPASSALSALQRKLGEFGFGCFGEFFGVGKNLQAALAGAYGNCVKKNCGFVKKCCVLLFHAER